MNLLRFESSGRLAVTLAIGVGLVLVQGPGPRYLSAQTLPTSDTCRDCHLELDEERLVRPAVDYEADVHAHAGFGCLECHGSAGRTELEPAVGFLGVPDRQRIADLCGRCHSDAAYMRQFNPSLRVDQVIEYRTSTHGRLLLEEDDPDVATCVDCHPAHGIRSPSDPESSVYAGNVLDTCGRCHADQALMERRGHAWDQLEKYSRSVHGVMLLEEGDMSAPVCNDCHGNHGAAPPGITSVRNVCGQCHSVMADYFAESGHASIFEMEDLPGCALCHEHHEIRAVSDDFLMDRSVEVCADCHTAGDTLGLEFERMAHLLDSLDEATEHSRALLEEAENVGMEVSQAFFELEDINNARTQARSAIHTFHADAVAQEVDTGLEIAIRAEERGLEALREYDVRRLGLGVSSGIMLLLITGLFLKIKDTEQRLEEIVLTVEAYYERAFAATAAGKGTPKELRLAACALLLEATYADGRFTDDERAHLENLFRDRFGLTDHEVAELIGLAERERESPQTLGQLAGLIAEGFTSEQKRNLINELWVLVYADGELTAREVEFMEDVSKMLGVDASAVAAARRRVLEGDTSVTPFGGDEG